MFCSCVTKLSRLCRSKEIWLPGLVVRLFFSDKNYCVYQFRNTRNREKRIKILFYLSQYCLLYTIKGKNLLLCWFSNPLLSDRRKCNSRRPFQLWHLEHCFHRALLLNSVFYRTPLLLCISPLASSPRLTVDLQVLMHLLLLTESPQHCCLLSQQILKTTQVCILAQYWI